MTTSGGARDPQPVGRETSEPAELEALLPWYAAGTLRRRATCASLASIAAIKRSMTRAGGAPSDSFR